MSTLPVIGLALVMMATGAGFVYYLIRGNASGRPEGGLQWTAVGLSVLLVVSSGVLLVLSIVVYAGGGSVQWSPNTTTTPTSPANVETGQQAPSFRFHLVEDGAPAELSEYEGKVVVLNFWATWCAPCLRELPDLNELYVTYEQEGLVVLTLSDEPRDVLVDFMQESPLQTVAGVVSEARSLPQPFARTLSIRPTSYVIDRDGTIRHFVAGARNYAFFEEVIIPLL